MWFKKNKWKIIVPILAAALLIAAFWYGGGAPGTRGWSISESKATSLPIPVSATRTPAAESVAPEFNGADSNGEVQLPVEGDSDKVTETQLPETTNPGTPEPTATLTAPPTEEPNETSAIMEVTPSPTLSVKAETDRYQTDPVPDGKPLPVEWQDVTVGTTEFTCTLSINCETILDNMDWLDSEKHELVPEDGWILKPITVTFYEGESVLNVLQRTCKQQKIHMEFVNTPIYNSAYIEGINNIYEFDVGEISGWMYKVNDWFPNYGCSRYQLKDGDVIEWMFTCALGDDIGGGYAVGNGA